MSPHHLCVSAPSTSISSLFISAPSECPLPICQWPLPFWQCPLPNLPMPQPLRQCPLPFQQCSFPSDPVSSPWTEGDYQSRLYPGTELCSWGWAELFSVPSGGPAAGMFYFSLCEGTKFLFQRFFRRQNHEEETVCVCDSASPNRWRKTLSQILHIAVITHTRTHTLWPEQSVLVSESILCVSAEHILCLMDRQADTVQWIILDYSWTFCPGTRDEEEEGASRNTPSPPVRENASHLIHAKICFTNMCSSISFSLSSC